MGGPKTGGDDAGRLGGPKTTWDEHCGGGTELVGAVGSWTQAIILIEEPQWGLVGRRDPIGKT